MLTAYDELLLAEVRISRMIGFIKGVLSTSKCNVELLNKTLEEEKEFLVDFVDNTLAAKNSINPSIKTI